MNSLWSPGAIREMRLKESSFWTTCDVARNSLTVDVSGCAPIDYYNLYELTLFWKNSSNNLILLWKKRLTENMKNIPKTVRNLLMKLIFKDTRTYDVYTNRYKILRRLLKLRNLQLSNTRKYFISLKYWLGVEDLDTINTSNSEDIFWNAILSIEALNKLDHAWTFYSNLQLDTPR